jgi:putative sterol carrier protein
MAGATVADAIAEFFDELSRRGHEPLLQKITGTFRFDVTGGPAEHWYVAVERGRVTVSRRNAKADCSVRADRETFAAIASGQANALAATLRGAAVIEGDVGLLAGFQRLFPGPPAGKPKPKARAARRKKPERS